MSAMPWTLLFQERRRQSTRSSGWLKSIARSRPETSVPASRRRPVRHCNDSCGVFLWPQLRIPRNAEPRSQPRSGPAGHPDGFADQTPIHAVFSFSRPMIHAVSFFPRASPLSGRRAFKAVKGTAGPCRMRIRFCHYCREQHGLRAAM